MRIAMFSWESLHSVAVGGVAAHVTELAAALQRKGHEVHVFTRPGYRGSSVSQIDGVWHHYCSFNLNRNFIDEIQGMCRSFVWHDVNGLRIYRRVDSVGWRLGTLFKDFEWARWMGQNGRIAVETTFTWDRIADITLQCHRSWADADSHRGGRVRRRRRCG